MDGVRMEKLLEALKQYGKERELGPGEVLIRQGSVSDGVYYLKRGRLGVYREDRSQLYCLSEVTPGEMVGELGAATGRSRSATVKAEEASSVVHISAADFRQALDEAPAMMAEVIDLVGERLTDVDIVLVTLDRSYQYATERVRALSSEKEQLEELLRLREELSELIVHDLRNPLAVVYGSMEILQRVSLPESEAEYATAALGAMERSIRRMQRMVDTLLDITHLETGQVTLQTEPIDIKVLVDEVMAEEQALAQHSAVTLESKLPADLPPVQADRDLLLRVLCNLVDNGLKFTRKRGKVWIEVRAEPQSLRFEVVDTGHGIPLKDRTRIFEKFTQVQRQGMARRGSGLGLAFCRMAVEAHGGRIWVEDGPEGKGSRFVFQLPRSAEDSSVD
jgi:signal transduction histidine kinase